MRQRPAHLLLVLPLASLALVACDAPVPGEPGSAEASPSASSSVVIDDGETTGYSFASDNCGFEVTRTTPPERIVTVKSTMTDVVAALGAADRLVGVAYQDGEISVEDPVASGEVALGAEQDLAATLADVPVLADRWPSQESVLDLEPDLVMAGWETTFLPDYIGHRDELEDLGITTFVAPVACTEPPYLVEPVRFEDVFAQITEIGALLGLPEEAGRVVTELRDQLAAGEVHAAEVNDSLPGGDEATALWWSSGIDVPYVGAGEGVPQMLLDSVGLTNIAEELLGGWSPLSWEAAAGADPTYIVLVDSTWNTAEDKKAQLAANPVMAQTSAVQNERYLVVPFAATEAGVRNVEAVWTLADQRAELGAP